MKKDYAAATFEDLHIKTNSSLRGSIAALLLAAAFVPALHAVEALPEFSDTWVNGGPYQLASLKDKVVVLYFFEVR